MTELLAGRYRIDGLLGRGGMSEVYHGYDERLDRRVAIKVLRPPASAPDAPDSPEAVEILDALERDRKRFLREIRVTARLEHPGTPAVYDTGVETAPDGGGSRLWLVMQLLRGSTLETVLNQTEYSPTPPSMAWAAAIAAQIAAVLADVHRDIKPANVMVTDGGLVKVLDFGIASLRGAGALPRLTQIDSTVGTPAYMSPEQWLGQVVSTASDVYSLGCVLLELLTGDVPFFATSDLPLRSQHLTSIAPHARARRADVPVELDALVSSMLAKEPLARPTAEQVYAALLPLTTPHLGPGPDARGTPAASIGTSGIRGGADHQDPTRPFRWPLLAPAASRPAPASDDHQNKLTDTEASLLLDSAGALLDSDRPSAAVSLLDDGIERAAHDPALQLQLRRMLGAALFYGGEYGRAATVLDAVGQEYLRFRAANDPDVLECAYHAGYAYAECGKTRKALAQLRFYVLNADVSGDGVMARNILETRFVVGQLLAADGRPDEALDELRAVRPLLAEAFGLDSTQVRNLDKQAKRLETGR